MAIMMRVINIKCHVQFRLTFFFLNASISRSISFLWRGNSISGSRQFFGGAVSSTPPPSSDSSENICSTINNKALLKICQHTSIHSSFTSLEISGVISYSKLRGARYEFWVIRYYFCHDTTIKMYLDMPAVFLSWNIFLVLICK